MSNYLDLESLLPMTTLEFCGTGIGHTEVDQRAELGDGPVVPLVGARGGYVVAVTEGELGRARRLAPVDVGRLPDLHSCQLGPGVTAAAAARCPGTEVVMTLNVAGQLNARLGATCQFLEPSRLVKAILDCAENGDAVVIFDDPAKLTSKRVLHQASLRDLWRQAAAAPMSVRLTFNHERRAAVIFLSHSPLPPAITRLNANINEEWKFSEAKDLADLHGSLQQRYPHSLAFRRAVRDVRRREIYGAAVEPSPLLPLPSTLASHTGTAVPLCTALLVEWGRAVLASATASTSAAAHQQRRVRRNGVDTVAQVSVRFNRTEAEELDVDRAWSGTASTHQAVSVPEVSQPYRASSLSYLDKDGLYGHLLPKDWSTAGAVMTMLGGCVSTSWAVHLLGLPRRQPEAPIRLRFAQALQPFADLSAHGDAQPSAFFRASASQSRRPALQPHARLVACLKSVEHLRSTFSVAVHRDALAALLVATPGRSVFKDVEAAGEVVRHVFGGGDNLDLHRNHIEGSVKREAERVAERRSP